MCFFSFSKYIQGAQLLVDIESKPDKMTWFNKVFDNEYNSPLECEQDQWLGHFVSLMSHLFWVPLESHCSLSLLDFFHCTQIPLDSSQRNLTPQYPLDTSQYPLLGSPLMNWILGYPNCPLTWKTVLGSKVLRPLFYRNSLIFGNSLFVLCCFVAQFLDTQPLLYSDSCTFPCLRLRCSHLPLTLGRSCHCLLAGLNYRKTITKLT